MRFKTRRKEKKKEKKRPYPKTKATYPLASSSVVVVSHFDGRLRRRAGDADGDRRVLGDAACGDRGGGRASGSATAWAMRKEMSRLSSGTGVFFGFGRGCFTGGGVLVLMAASRHRQPSGGTGAHFPAWPRPQLLSRGPRLIWAFAAPFFGTLGFLAPHFMRHGSAAEDQ